MARGENSAHGANAEIIVRIRSTLQGPVMATMRQLVPELGHVPADLAYDHTLGSIYLLDRCFQTFREKRDRFRHLLVDAAGNPVVDGSGPLACGRSLEQVVAMVVRTCARRHFRHRVGATERQPVGPREAAEELYHCLKHYLLFDWQVPLVPLYARLIPDQVRALGQRLLDLKTPAALAGAAGLPVPDRADVPAAAPANSNTAPAAPSVAAPKSVEARVPALAGMLTTDGKRLNASAFALTLLAPEVRAVLPRREFALHPTAVLGSVGAEAAEALVERLSLRRDRLAVLLMSVYDVAGGEAFLRLFGQGAEPYLIDRLVAHARQSGIGADSSLADVAAFVTRAFSRLKATSVRG